MFNGLTRSLALVVGFLVVLPAGIILAAEGPDWLEKLSVMNPLF